LDYCAEEDFVISSLTGHSPIPEKPPWRSGGMGDDAGDREIMRQIYDTNAHVKVLLERGAEDRANAKDENERLWIELRAMKHDSNNREMVINRTMELTDRRQGEIERRIGEVERTIKDIATSVKPLTDLRSKVLGVAGLVTAVGFFLWVFAAPVWDAWVHRLLGPPPGH
jgi:hypothetical protein